jgi:hypothetical protein
VIVENERMNQKPKAEIYEYNRIIILHLSTIVIVVIIIIISHKMTFFRECVLRFFYARRIFNQEWFRAS